MFALDHIHYARLITIHIAGLLSLEAEKNKYLKVLPVDILQLVNQEKSSQNMQKAVESPKYQKYIRNYQFKLFVRECLIEELTSLNNKHSQKE